MDIQFYFKKLVHMIVEVQGQIIRTGQQAADPGEDHSPSSKAACSQNFFLLREGQSLLHLYLQLLEEVHPHYEANLLCSKFNNLKVNLIQKTASQKSPEQCLIKHLDSRAHTS